jgi:hypothetical protein
MKNQKVIIKFDTACERNDDRYPLRRIEGYATPDSIIRLLDIADLEANPREAKRGEVTDEIMESLGRRDGLFQFKSKGLLISAGDVRPLERKRYELHFREPAFEGILDGGHNTLAIALFILQETLGDESTELKKVKRWEDLAGIWKAYRSDIGEIQDALDFLIPVEVIYPHEGKKGQDQFEAAILEIAQARNNNAELTVETKANKAGYYDDIKAAIDPKLVEAVEWKSGDGGRIKVRDLVALAWIPLTVLQQRMKPKDDFNRVQIYSSKGACSSAFNDLVEMPEVSASTRGGIRSLIHVGVKSALTLLRDLPELYDLIYARFPEAYNTSSQGFGRISAVRMYVSGKKGSKYLRSMAKTKFYQRQIEYDYPDGFIMPLVVGLRALMEERDGQVRWKVDPRSFINEHLNEVVSSYYSAIQMADYDPQKVGKAMAAYNLAESAFRLMVDRGSVR